MRIESTRTIQPPARGHRSGTERQPIGRRTTRRAGELSRRLPVSGRAVAPRLAPGPKPQAAGGAAAFEPSASLAVKAGAVKAGAVKASLVKPTIHNFLELPHFSKEVPSTLDFSSGGEGARTLGAIATAFLDCGILHQSNWQGNLADTLHYALHCYVHGLCGADQLTTLANLDLYFFGDSNDDGSWNSAPGLRYHWFDVIGGNRDLPYGCFTFICSPYNNDMDGVCVGASVMKIEDIHAGAGFALMGLIDLACAMTVCGLTPRWALGAAQHYHSFDRDRAVTDDEFDGDESGLITEDDFFTRIPLDACTTLWDAKARKAVKAALLSLGNLACEDIEGQILRAALELDDAVQQAQYQLKRWDNTDGKTEDTLNQQWALFKSGDFPSFWVRWSQGDPTIRLLDDHMEGLWECGGVTMIEDDTGEGSPVVYLRAFQLGLPEKSSGSIHSALRAVGHTIHIMVQLEKLLLLMHSKEAPPPHEFKKPRQPRRKKAKTLDQIFREEAPSV